MTSPRDKILQLIANGTISPEEGDKLLSAIKPEPSFWDKWLLDPFSVMETSAAWLLALLVAAGSIALYQFDIRFLGALDIQTFKDASLTNALVDQLAAWICMALCFYLVARAAKQKASLLEMMAFVGAARLPHLIAGIFTVLAQHYSWAKLTTIFIIPLIGWTMLALISGFRIASNAKGKSLAMTFFIALSLSEILSKLIIEVLK